MSSKHPKGQRELEWQMEHFGIVPLYVNRGHNAEVCVDVQEYCDKLKAENERLADELDRLQEVATSDITRQARNDAEALEHLAVTHLFGLDDDDIHLIDRAVDAIRALADENDRLRIASDPRHCWPCEECGHVVEVACELGTENDRLRADAERLDWLEDNGWGRDLDAPGDIRDAIDAARKETEGE